MSKNSLNQRFINRVANATPVIPQAGRSRPNFAYFRDRGRRRSDATAAYQIDYGTKSVRIGVSFFNSDDAAQGKQFLKAVGRDNALNAMHGKDGVEVPFEVIGSDRYHDIVEFIGRNLP